MKAEVYSSNSFPVGNLGNWMVVNSSSPSLDYLVGAYLNLYMTRYSSGKSAVVQIIIIVALAESGLSVSFTLLATSS